MTKTNSFYLYPDNTFKAVTRGKPPIGAVRVEEGDSRLVGARLRPGVHVLSTLPDVPIVNSSLLCAGGSEATKAADTEESMGIDDVYKREVQVSRTVEKVLVIDHNSIKCYTPEEFEALPKP